MSIKIGSNIASIQAQRRLGEATLSLSKIYEKLSSGQRINSASDDAAGLAIADDLNSRTRVYVQGIRNGNDGLSVLAIADSASETLSGVVTRIRELAEQSANGSYSNTQREALDREAQALKKEFARITQTTTFNGVKIFDGSLGDGLRVQVGYGLEGSINASIGGAVGTGSFSSNTTIDADSRYSRAVALGDLNGDGILDLVTAGQQNSVVGEATVRLGNGNGSFGTATSYSTEGATSFAVALGDLNGDGVLDLVTAGTDGSGHATVRLGSGNGTFGTATSFNTESYISRAMTLGDLNGDGILDLVTAGQSSGNNGYATIKLGVGNGSFGTSTSYATESATSYAVSLGDLNGDGILDLVTAGTTASDGYATVRLGSGSGTFGAATSFATESRSSYAATLGDLNGDGILDLVSAGDSDAMTGHATVRLGTGNGSFGTATSYVTESRLSAAVLMGDLDGDGILDLTTAGYGGGGYTTVRLGTGTGSFGSAKSTFNLPNNGGGSGHTGLSMGDVNGDGVNDILASGYFYNGSNYDGKVAILLGEAEDGLGAMLDFSLKTQASAIQSMGMLQRTQESLAKQRGEMGASQSRISIALNNLATSKENFAAAESRIRDADIASETANLVRTRIVQQAASSVLAQANQAPALALMLL